MSHKKLYQEKKLSPIQYLITFTQGLSVLAEICPKIFLPSFLSISDILTITIPKKTVILVPVKYGLCKRWHIVTMDTKKRYVIEEADYEALSEKIPTGAHIAFLLDCPYKKALIHE